ncbi:hypothetical protein BH23CHL1_BH23CHL1_10150 [soil metagenome]
MDLSDWGIIVAIVSGMYGAVLSTIVAVTSWAAQRLRIRLIANSYDFGLPNDLNSLRIVIQVVNVGEKPVTLDEYRLKLWDYPDHWRSAMGGFALPSSSEQSVELPHSLEPGRSMKLSVPLSGIAGYARTHGYSGRVKVSAVFCDQTGRPWVLDKRNLIEIDVDHLESAPLHT